MYAVLLAPPALAGVVAVIPAVFLRGGGGGSGRCGRCGRYARDVLVMEAEKETVSS